MRQRKSLIFVSSILFLISLKNSSASPVIGTSAAWKNSSSSDVTNENITKPEEYRDVISYEDGFLAVGSDGRIDRISKTGKITRSEKFPGEEFNCILSYNQMIIVAGVKGSILISSNKGPFKKVDSGSDNNINSLVFFKDKIIAGTDRGEILIGDEKDQFKKIQLDLKGNIVSLSARTSDCYGVTYEGEIIHTIDGIKWTVFDFNKVYEGFYKPCHFTKVLATEKQIAICGKQNDGLPVLIFSNRGTVWSERTLSYTDDQGFLSYLEETPNDLFYDFSGDRFILVCNNGKVMIIPSCSHCNKLFEFSDEDIKSISGNENSLIIVGENNYIKTINIEFF